MYITGYTLWYDPKNHSGPTPFTTWLQREEEGQDD